ncbi:MAG: PEP-CTERM sorting domain-containing protein [Verrucomicrobiales bacterium]|jgi:hypothetical protein|nr:PEP-CTERM sorting domain-containing protein [Verrucomicrobiales bacterium]
MKMNHNINWRAMLKVSGIVMMAALTMNLNADTYTLNGETLADGGTVAWDSSATYWLLNGTATTLLPQGGADVVIDNATGADPLVFTYGFGGTAAGVGNVDRNSLTISDSVTLKVTSGNRIGYTTMTNRGLMEVTVSRSIAGNAAGNQNVTLTNSGTFRLGAGATLTLRTNSITNTGGLIDVGSGATFSLGSGNGNGGISGGALNVADGATFTNGADVNGTALLSGVAIDNVGVTVVSQVGGLSGNRVLQHTATNGVFNNTGTVVVSQGTTHNFTNANSTHTVTFTQSGANVFTNSGVVSVLNESVTSLDYLVAGVNFTVANNSAADGKFTNDGRIDIRNNARGANTGTTYARFTVNNGADFTNTGTINVALGDDTTDDALHTATLFINTDWTNTGAITVDRANKALATASFELNGKVYTQTGAGSEMRLLNGGQLKAVRLNINGGTLGGAGVITGTTTINSGATLDPDGTLTLDSLIMNEGSILNFSAAADDFLQINGNLNFNGATLTLTDYLGGDPLLLATYTGDLLGQNLNVSAIPDAVLDFDIIGKNIYLSIIPEPAPSFLLLLGGIILALTVRRRRRAGGVTGDSR